MDCKRCIENAGSNLWLSDVTALEITLKWKSGKLTLPLTPKLWFQSQISIWNLKTITIKREHIFKLSDLDLIHKDPFDRLLVSQAICENFEILTPDPLIKKYPVSVLW